MGRLGIGYSSDGTCCGTRRRHRSAIDDAVEFENDSPPLSGFGLRRETWF
jgi:hypothetical protein